MNASHYAWTSHRGELDEAPVRRSRIRSWALDALRPANQTEALAGAVAETLADQFAALAARLADIDAKLREFDESPRGFLT
jgi:hypothetical protein